MARDKMGNEAHLLHECGRGGRVAYTKKNNPLQAVEICVEYRQHNKMAVKGFRFEAHVQHTK